MFIIKLIYLYNADDFRYFFLQGESGSPGEPGERGFKVLYLF